MISCHFFVKHEYVCRFWCQNNLNLCLIETIHHRKYGFHQSTRDNTIIDTKPKLGIGLGSHKKLVLTPEQENPSHDQYPSTHICFCTTCFMILKVVNYYVYNL